MTPVESDGASGQYASVVPPETWAVLAEVSTRLSGAASVDELARALASGLKWVANFDRALFASVEGDAVRVWEIPGLRVETRDASDPVGVWLSAVAAGGKPMFEAPVAAGLPWPDGGAPVAALAVLPLMDGDRGVGVLAFASRSGDAYTPVRRAPLSLLALQLAGQVVRLRAVDALLSAREELEEQVRRRTALLELTNRELTEELGRRKRSEAALAAESVERDRLELELRQALKMEAIGRLAGGVAHDFNNMLTAIVGYSKLALKQVEPDSRVARQIGEIYKAGERAGALTRQLLAFSRRQALRPEPVDLGSLVADMMGMLRRLISEGIDLTTTCDEGLWIAEADPSQVEQVVMNLVVNARDATAGRGTIALRTHNLEVEEDDQSAPSYVVSGRYAALSVADAGCGMDAATIDRIFEPFFTTKAVGEGTGLGLSTVYGIVKQSGGYVWAESEVGVGTTFVVCLPARTASVVSREAARSEPLARGDEIVLLVEDDDVLRSVAREGLEEAGYTVLAASDGVVALDVYRDNASRIDIVVTDVVMPRLGGPELVAAIEREGTSPPVLYMSGYAEEFARGTLPLDSAAYLSKPFTPDQLADAVRRALDRRK